MRRNTEAGQSLYLTAAGLVVLMGFAGLAIDMGVLRYDRRLQQAAADAAAIAGASNLGQGGVVAGAQNASAANGFTDNSSGSSCTSTPPSIGCVTLTVNNPPVSGPHTGNNKYVEVIVSSVQPTYFMKALGTNQETVAARAVATNVSGATTPNGCLYTLGPPASSIEGVNINGHATLNAITCGIVDNGDFNTSGNALTVNAGTFGVSGSWDGCSQQPCGGNHGTETCTGQPASDCPALGMPASSDPLSYLTSPCSNGFSCSGGSALSTNGGATWNPGTYSSISIAGNGTVTFNAGIYIIDSSAGFSCNGTPTINGTGVMFYFTNGATINCEGNDNINLVAPSPSNCPSCPTQYDGILFYQDPNDTNTNGPALGGNTGSAYDGALYFPKDQLTFFGHNNTLDAAIVVADSVALSGTPTVNLEGTSGLPPGVNIITIARLVE
jgi:Flp pilus assembly protein TadG